MADDTPAPFDPTEHTAADVAAYLADPLTSPEEVERVRSAESLGANRVTVEQAAARAAGRTPIPDGSTFVAVEPDGEWHALVDDRGELVKVGGEFVRVR